MSLISVDTEALKDIEKKFGTLSQKLGQTESSLKSIRSNLDSDIKKRNGIDSKLQNLIKELDEEETVLNQVTQFLSKTIKQYQDIEKSMQNKVNEINGDTKTKTNIFSKILDAAISSLRKKVEIIQKIISLPVIIGSTIIGNTVIKGVGDILSEEGSKVTNEPIEEKKEKTDDSSIPPISGVLSYNPNVYSEEVLMLQKRLNEIYAGVSGYKKIKEDGYFGPETLEAVNRYKEEYGLWNFGEYEGKVGETTWNHLFKNEKVPYTPPVVRSNDNITVSTYKIPISFEEAVKNEYNAKSKNPITGKDEYACVKSQDGKWVRATEAEIRYYMDPNNFVNDPVNKYQFLVLGNVGGFEITPQNREEIINRLNDLLKGRGVLDGMGEAFVKASEETGIALPYLVAHCALETGWGTSDLAKGLDKNGNYTGYYNMFGICAYDSDPVANAINKAKSENWNSVEKAIIGGAQWIKENYISNPEKNTLYKMRWQPVSPLGNQYATDIAWAINQCSTIKEVYELFPEAELIFDIPEYAFSETPKVSNNSGVSINSGNKDVDRMLSIATEQWGYREKGENLTPYGEWYGMNGQPWCVMFISWCADQAGILGTVVPKEAHAFYMKQGYIKDGRYRERESGYIPRAGDTIIFSKGVTGTDPVSRENKEYYHGAIVVGYDPETETVYTIEGNKGDEVRYCAYNLRFVEIDGYGINGGTTNGFIPENIYSYKASTY